MNEEELNSIQELIERKLLMSKVMGGLTSQDKKFINLWNYAMQLQNNWNGFKNWLEEQWKQSQDIWFVKVIGKMQEMEQGKDE